MLPVPAKSEVVRYFYVLSFSFQNRFSMILSTTPTLQGKGIAEYKGIVFGETIVGANMFRDIAASIRDVIGGRSGSYERVLAEARQTALKELEDRAREMGAHAVVGIDIDYEVVGASGSMLMVSASGTAVTLSTGY